MAQIGKLIGELARTTRTGRLHWVETGVPDEFEVDLGTAAVARIRRTADVIVFRVMRHDGRVVEEVEEMKPVWDPECEDWQFGRQESWVPLDELFGEARRSAMEADDVIDSALKFVTEKR